MGKFYILVGALVLTVALSVSLVMPLCTTNTRLEFTADDEYYIVFNPRVLNSQFSTIWSTPMRLEYFPVTLTSFAAEYQLWKGDVRLFHLVGILLFCGIGILSCVLTCEIVGECGGEPRAKRRIAWAAAAMTGLAMMHPANVEAFASISNQKELLYVLFSLLALKVFLSGRPGSRRLLMTGMFMVLAQLSKGSAVILPLMLLICELQREEKDGLKLQRRLAPLLLLSSVAAVIFLFQIKVAYYSGVVANAENIAGGSRFGGFVRTLNTMIGTFLWPAHLSFDYDIPWPSSLPQIVEWLMPLALVAILLVVFKTGKRRTVWITLLVLVPLVPYLNIFPLGNDISGKMVFYDHYLLYTIMLIPVLTTYFLASYPSLSKWGVVLAMAGVVALTTYDRQLACHWQNRESLYRWVINTSPHLPKGYLFLGMTYLDEGRYAEAKQSLLQVFSKTGWEQSCPETYQLLGDTNVRLGDYRSAAWAYRAHLEYNPNNIETMERLVKTLITLHDYAQARQIIAKWLSYSPNNPSAIRALATLPTSP